MTYIPPQVPTYAVGEAALFKTLFEDITQDPAITYDPDTVTLLVIGPSGTLETYAYPADIERLDTGSYQYQRAAFTANDAGVDEEGWWYRWVGGGSRPTSHPDMPLSVLPTRLA